MQKNRKKEIVDPESTEWLFEQGFIQLSVSPEGLAVDVTQEGICFLEMGEDYDLYKKTSANHSKKSGNHSKILVRAILCCLYLTVLAYIIIKQFKG